MIQNVARGRFLLGNHDGCVGPQAGDRHGAVGPGGVESVVGADHMTVAVLDQELSAGERLMRHGVSFQNGQSAEGIVIKTEGLRVPCIDYHRLGSGVLLIKVGSLVLGHDQRSGLDLREHDLSVLVRGIKAVGTGQALVVRQQLAVGIHDFELCAGKRLLGDLVVFFDDQPAFRGIGHNNSLGISVGADHDIGAGRINDVARRSLDFG